MDLTCKDQIIIFNLMSDQIINNESICLLRSNSPQFKTVDIFFFLLSMGKLINSKIVLN